MPNNVHISHNVNRTVLAAVLWLPSAKDFGDLLLKTETLNTRNRSI